MKTKHQKTRKAIRKLQKALGTPQDGIFSFVELETMDHMGDEQDGRDRHPLITEAIHSAVHDFYGLDLSVAEAS